MSEVVWKPYGDYVEKSNITRFMRKHGIGDYEELVERSCDELEWFWDAIMEDLDIRWYKPYEKVLDTSAGIPWAKWYLGGKTNVVLNCLDKHMETPVRDKLAFIWEGDDGAIRRYTYKDVYRETCRTAGVLRGIGVEKGDVVGLYMPMIPADRLLPPRLPEDRGHSHPHLLRLRPRAGSGPPEGRRGQGAHHR
jgi:acetyl-CoA synthetase